MSGRQHPLSAAVLDLDGVLVDSEGINVEAARRAFAAHGIALDDADAALIVGRHPRDYLADLVRRHPEAAGRIERIAAHQGRIYAGLARAVRPVPGAEDLVRGLRRRGLRLALATSSNRAGAEAALAGLGLRDAFDAVLALEDVTRRKPDPEVYRRACAALRVDPAAAVAVEDSEPGCRAARDAGLRVVALDREDRLAAAGVPADVVVRSNREALAWIESLPAGGEA